MRFFQIPSEFTYVDVVNNCSLATVGDVGISLAAFISVTVLSKSRRWIVRPNWWQASVFVFIGIAMTIVFEALATEVLNIWKYGDTMPTLPVLGTGLLPMLQWLIVPLLIILFVKRQFRSANRKSSG